MQLNAKSLTCIHHPYCWRQQNHRPWRQQVQVLHRPKHRISKENGVSQMDNFILHIFCSFPQSDLSSNATPQPPHISE